MSSENGEVTENDDLGYRVPNRAELELERKTFCIVQTDGQETSVKGTRMVRPSDRDGLLIVDDTVAQEGGVDLSSEDAGDSFVVLVIPNATLKLAYIKEHEEESDVQDEWSVDEEMEI